MRTAVLDEVLCQREPTLKQAVEESLVCDIGRIFEKFGLGAAEVKRDYIVGVLRLLMLSR